MTQLMVWHVFNHPISTKVPHNQLPRT